MECQQGFECCLFGSICRVFQDPALSIFYYAETLLKSMTDLYMEVYVRISSRLTQSLLWKYLVLYAESLLDNQFWILHSAYQSLNSRPLRFLPPKKITSPLQTNQDGIFPSSRREKKQQDLQKATVDGRNPAPLGMYKNLQIMG